tara:strand:- start:688 stop:2397 length:1710 start_codon:yes stop_codon:yes gene_type:complete
MTDVAEQNFQLTETSLRPPEFVMKLDRLGSFFPTRLSFTRTLMRRIVRESWDIRRETFDLDKDGVGTAIYKIETPHFPLWFVVFANHLEPKDRTDRVIAEKWDATFTLTSEKPENEKLNDLKQNIPLQEAGRCSSNELILSRANKSVRLFDYVIDKLASGQQPDPKKLMAVGYLMRTTAVYGNGKFGLADFDYAKQQGIFKLPFQAEMLCVYLARNFSFDWVEHIAKNKNRNSFKPLETHLKRALGIGNATGLGMAPFLIDHPKLISNWITVREEALARVTTLDRITDKKLSAFKELLSETQNHIEEWPTTDKSQKLRLLQLKNELKNSSLIFQNFSKLKPWKTLTNWAHENLSLETQEILHSIIIELYPELVDELEFKTGSDELMFVEPNMTLLSLKTIIETQYSWVRTIDLQGKKSNARFWYRSEEKEEPRLGWRYEEPGSEKEMRLGIAQTVNDLDQKLAQSKETLSKYTVGDFLIKHPQFREIIQRVQSLRNAPYAEIRENLLHKDCRPVNLLRCKLAMFGATKFDPKSDLWVRIALFQGAPLVQEVAETDSVDGKLFPSLQNHL